MQSAFKNLFNCYAHEMSTYNTWLGTQINADGIYVPDVVEKCFTSDEKTPFVITENGLPIGFVVFESFIEDNVWFHNIDEMFVVKTSRKNGVCSDIVRKFWNENSGMGMLYVLKTNLPAITYWEKLLKDSGYTYIKNDENEQVWLYKFKLN